MMGRFRQWWNGERIVELFRLRDEVGLPWDVIAERISAVSGDACLRKYYGVYHRQRRRLRALRVHAENRTRALNERAALGAKRGQVNASEELLRLLREAA